MPLELAINDAARMDDAARADDAQCWCLKVSSFCLYEAIVFPRQTYLSFAPTPLSLRFALLESFSA